MNAESLNISFRAMTAEDIPTLRDWLHYPHVAEFWQEPTDEAAFREKYLEKLGKRGVRPHLVLLDGRAIGYIQAYEACHLGDGWWPDAVAGTYGIDQYIGEPDCIGRGIGSAMVRRFVEALFTDPAVRHIITDPEPGNARAIRAYEKAGFRQVGLTETPGGEAMLMRIEREVIHSP